MFLRCRSTVRELASVIVGRKREVEIDGATPAPETFLRKP